MDAKDMAALLDGISGNRSLLPDPATLTDTELISEFQELYTRRTTDDTLTPNERKAATVRMRGLAAEKMKREESAATERKATRRKAEAENA